MRLQLFRVVIFILQFELTTSVRVNYPFNFHYFDRRALLPEAAVRNFGGREPANILKASNFD